MENRAYNAGFQLRFPDGMRELVKTSAAENGRSMNAEIIYRLKSTYLQKENEKAEARS